MGVKRKTGETPSFLSFFQVSAVARAATAVVFVSLAVLIISSGGYYYWPRLTVGESALEDVYASIDFTFRDDAKTESKRQEKAQRVPTVYKLDERRVAQDLDKLIGLVRKASQAKDPSSATVLLCLELVLVAITKNSVAGLLPLKSTTITSLHFRSRARYPSSNAKSLLSITSSAI